MPTESTLEAMITSASCELGASRWPVLHTERVSGRKKEKQMAPAVSLKAVIVQPRTVVIETGRRGRTFSQAVTHSESQRPEEVITWRSSGE